MGVLLGDNDLVATLSPANVTAPNHHSDHETEFLQILAWRRSLV